MRISDWSSDLCSSDLAKTLDVLVRQFLSKQAKQLAYGDDNLVDLNDFFRSWVARQGVAVRAYFETEKTYGVHVVDKVTANPGVTGCEPIGVQTDHITIRSEEHTSELQSLMRISSAVFCLK